MRVLPGLPEQILQDEQIDTLTTDGIYDTKGCPRQAEAISPPRRNTKSWKSDDPDVVYRVRHFRRGTPRKLMERMHAASQMTAQEFRGARKALRSHSHGWATTTKPQGCALVSITDAMLTRIQTV